MHVFKVCFPHALRKRFSMIASLIIETKVINWQVQSMPVVDFKLFIHIIKTYIHDISQNILLLHIPVHMLSIPIQFKRHLCFLLFVYALAYT